MAKKLTNKSNDKYKLFYFGTDNLGNEIYTIKRKLFWNVWDVTHYGDLVEKNKYADFHYFSTKQKAEKVLAKLVS